MNIYDKEYRQKEIECRAEMKRIDEKISQRRKQIERLEKKRHRVWASYGWYNDVVVRLMHDLEKETGLKGEIYGPYGLRAETSIYLREDMSKSICDTETWSIELENREDGTYYATGKESDEFEPMSIGWLNGFHHIMEPLPDTLEEIKCLLRHSN